MAEISDDDLRELEQLRKAREMRRVSSQKSRAKHVEVDRRFSAYIPIPIYEEVAERLRSVIMEARRAYERDQKPGKRPGQRPAQAPMQGDSNGQG